MGNIQDTLMRQFQSMDQAYEQYAKANGLNYLSLMVLEEIYELGDGCTQKQISDDIRYPKQSVNLVVKSFLEAGYVKLQEDPENRKNKKIALTETGNAFCRQVICPLLEQEEAVARSMGVQESRELERLLELYGTAYCEKMRALAIFRTR